SLSSSSYRPARWADLKESAKMGEEANRVVNGRRIADCYQEQVGTGCCNWCISSPPTLALPHKGGGKHESADDLANPAGAQRGRGGGQLTDKTHRSGRHEKIPRSTLKGTAPRQKNLHDVIEFSDTADPDHWNLCILSHLPHHAQRHRLDCRATQ